MKSEQEILEFCENMEDERWWTGDNAYFSVHKVIPFEIAIWLIKHTIKKRILGTIPGDVNGFYCEAHQSPYLEESEKGTGCEFCPKNNIWAEGE